VPDAPIDLQNVPFDVVDRANPSTTTDEQIRFTWISGPSDGGAVVIDHDIYWNAGSGETYSLLAENIVTNYFQTDATLSAGVTYSFRVTARNTVGDSAQSTAIAILAAKPPDAPTDLAEDA
jgi:hypothetical protein